MAFMASSSAASLARLLHCARGRRTVAEIGTGPGWTAMSLALADERRRVFTVDPFPHPTLERYAALVPASVMRRVEFSVARGEAGPPSGHKVDFLFVDEAHQHDSVIACFQAWQPALLPGAVVVFHDYHPTWPGVVSAVKELGLDGRARRQLLLARPWLEIGGSDLGPRCTVTATGDGASLICRCRKERGGRAGSCDEVKRPAGRVHLTGCRTNVSRGSPASRGRPGYARLGMLAAHAL
jgi:predicted O-methyltransferase YrrM